MSSITGVRRPPVPQVSLKRLFPYELFDCVRRPLVPEWRNAGFVRVKAYPHHGMAGLSQEWDNEFVSTGVNKMMLNRRPFREFNGLSLYSGDATVFEPAGNTDYRIVVRPTATSHRVGCYSRIPYAYDGKSILEAKHVEFNTIAEERPVFGPRRLATVRVRIRVRNPTPCMMGSFRVKFLPHDECIDSLFLLGERPVIAKIMEGSVWYDSEKELDIVLKPDPNTFYNNIYPFQKPSSRSYAEVCGAQLPLFFQGLLIFADLHDDYNPGMKFELDINFELTYQKLQSDSVVQYLYPLPTNLLPCTGSRGINYQAARNEFERK